MVGRADRQAWPSAGDHRCRDPGVPDAQGALWFAAPANDRDGGEPARPCGSGLARMHGSSKPRDWRKVDLGIDAETLEIRAIEITGSGIGDSPMLPDLLDQIPGDPPLGIVTADPPTTPALVTPPSLLVGQRPSFHSATTANPGRNAQQERPSATERSAVAAASAGRSGSAGPATTQEAWWRPRCGASSSCARASCLATSIAKSPSCRSIQPSLTASLPSERRSRSAQIGLSKEREGSAVTGFAQQSHTDLEMMHV